MLGNFVILAKSLIPDTAGEIGFLLLLHNLEQTRLCAVVDHLACLALHRCAPGVRLHAAASATSAHRSIGFDNYVPDFAGSAAALPELSVDDNSATNSGAAEDSQHRRVVATRTELILCDNSNLYVIGKDHRCAKRLPHWLYDLHAPEPIGQIGCAAESASLRINLARTTDTNTNKFCAG